MTTIGGVCLSSMTQWCLRCLKWIMQWTHPSSHSFSRLVHGERSDSHMLALMLYCSFSVHLLQHKLSNEPDFYEQSLIVSLGRDIKGNSGGLHHAEYSLYANTQLIKTKQVSVTCISKESAIKITVSNIHWLLWWWLKSSLVCELLSRLFHSRESGFSWALLCCIQ